jgi:hypothetical protein
MVEQFVSCLGDSGTSPSRTMCSCNAFFALGNTPARPIYARLGIVYLSIAFDHRVRAHGTGKITEETGMVGAATILQSAEAQRVAENIFPIPENRITRQLTASP